MRLPRLLELGTALAATLLVGCSAGAPWLGIQPDLHLGSGVDACADLKTVFDDATGIKDAYGWRAAYNRNAIYVGGVLLLGTAAATAGLGAAAAASLSIALVSVSGTFVSGSLALFNNGDLAACYTKAEKTVSDALTATRISGCLPMPSKTTCPTKCSETLASLISAVNNAKDTLEQDRLTAAQTAVSTEVKKLQDDMAAVKATQAAAPTAAVTVAPTVAPTAGAHH